MRIGQQRTYDGCQDKESDEFNADIVAIRRMIVRDSRDDGLDGHGCYLWRLATADDDGTTLLFYQTEGYPTLK